MASMLLCACYAHHEVEFEDIPDGCGIEPTFYEGMDCPESVFAVGEFARVDVRHRAGICCESGRNDLVIDELSPHEWELNATWTACGCDELLSCLGPQDAASVRVGPLLEGDNIVHAGEFSCVVVAEASRECASVPTGVVAPRVLFDDQVFSASVYHEASADCGCSTRMNERFELQICECGDFCDAVLTTYSGSAISDAFAPGEHTLRVAGMDHSLSVRELRPPLTPGGGCRPLEPTALQFAVPANNHAGPPLVWAGVSGEQSLCCTPELLLAARSERVGRDEIEVELFTCVFEDCLCGILPPPTTAVAWHDLGPLEPGEYTVRAGEIVQTLVVPTIR